MTLLHTTADEADSTELPRLLVAAGLFVFTIAGVLTAIFEVLLVPLRAGTVMLPIAVALAIASNILLPWMSRRISPDNFGASVPVVGWTVAVVVLASGRPEGDVILSGGANGDAVVGYALMIAGLVTGVATVLRMASVASSNVRRQRREGRLP